MARIYLLLAAASVALAAPGWKAGFARVSIAPSGPLWMAGYSARTAASEGVDLDVQAKALVLEDSSGRRSLLITTDMLGFTRGLAQRVAARIAKDHGIPRERLMLNSSHTHSGPVIERMLGAAYDATDAQWADVDRYTEDLENRIVNVAARAMKSLQPVDLSFGRGTAGFARNRRVAYHPNGPVDHGVPVLAIRDARGKLLAAVFGYACHNTTLGGEFRKFHGDYAGVAQARLEQTHRGATAFFITGCGADSNPNPRGTLDHVNRYGAELAAAVDKVLAGATRPVRGPLRAAFEEVALVFDTPPTKAEFEARLQDKNKYVARHARNQLDRIAREGRLPTEYPYPVQVWRFGGDLTIVALGGEVVVDYALRLGAELGADNLWVAGYSNDGPGYIPSERILQEGGYEGAGAMIYYGPPGPFAPGVEMSIVKKVHELVRLTGR